MAGFNERMNRYRKAVDREADRYYKAVDREADRYYKAVDRGQGAFTDRKDKAMAAVTYVVYYIVITRTAREFRVTSTVDVETPPADPDELKTVIWIKLMDRNPDAKEITILSIQ